MIDPDLATPDDIRTRSSRAMSEMYRNEAPQYGTLISLVTDVNGATLEADANLKAALERTDDLSRISLERHGAVRLGTAAELSTMGRLFGVMGMVPVGYYDLTVAGVPVRSTAVRPARDENLARNPFRVFTSLLRLELIKDMALREDADEILARRQIFRPGALALIERAEATGGLTSDEPDDVVWEGLQTFRWPGKATIDAETYGRLSAAHRLIADDGLESTEA